MTYHEQILQEIDIKSTGATIHKMRSACAELFVCANAIAKGRGKELHHSGLERCIRLLGLMGVVVNKEMAIESKT